MMKDILILMGKHGFFLLIISFLVCSCNALKYVPDDEHLVVKNNVLFTDSSGIKSKSSIKYQLGEIIEKSGQKPNSKFLGLTRANLWFYYKTNRPQDTTKSDRTIRKLFAEPPTLFRDDKCRATSRAMKNLMLNKGYLDAEVDYSYEFKKNKKARVQYTVDAGQLYKIGSFDLKSNDQKIDSLLHSKISETYFKRDAPLDARLYDKEKTRITTDLRNKGYAYFSNQYISTLSADTSSLAAEAYLEIQSSDSTIMRTYTVGDVHIYPFYFANDTLSYPFDTLIDGYHFMSRSRRHQVRPVTILRKIFFKPGQAFSQALIDQTYRNLNSLDIFKFVSIKYTHDPILKGVVDFNIYLVPNKKMVIGADLELNSSDYEGTSNLLGLSGGVLYRNRNFLRGAEIFEIRNEGGVEFNINNTGGLFSTEASIQSDLHIPRYINPYRFGKKSVFESLDRPNLFKRFRKNMSELATSKLSLGFNYLDYSDSYSYYSFNFSLGHAIPVSFFKQINFNRIGVDYFKPISLPSGMIPTLIEQSFTKQLFTGFFFRDISYLSRKTTDKDVTWTFKTNFEVSGLEIAAVNSIFNELSSSSETFQFPGDIEYSKYVRFDIERGFTKILTPHTGLAMRGTAGLAFPYSTSKTVPFVKQYFVGGPYSIRGWSVRELGPGGYEQVNTGTNSQPFFQTGDIKFELGLEYRFDLFWLFEGALFFDAGNIWTLLEDIDRPGSEFGNDFYKQIAIATGLGLRFDFTYFILRLDLGYKLKNPYQSVGHGYWAHPSLKDMLGQANYNIAIGYPF